MTATAVHSSTEDVFSEVVDSPFALDAAYLDEELRVEVPDFYEAPDAELDHVDYEDEPWLWFVVIVILYATALAYAAYCTGKGGSPVISLTWRGFRVACYK